MIVYARFNTRRLPQFRLTTTIERSGDRLIVSKRAANSAAAAFLQQLIETSKTLSAQPLPFAINTARSGKDSVEFDLVSGVSIESLLSAALRAKNRAHFTRVLGQYIDLVRALPQKTTVPNAAFRQVFGGALTAALPSALNGCLDLNMDNVIVDGDSKTLIDYEWCFPCEIPIDFIIFRAITAFYGNHLHEAPNAVMPLAQLFGDLGFSDQLLVKFAELEYGFQCHVYGADAAKKALEGKTLQERYALLARDPGLNNPADRAHRHAAFVRHIEKEDALKQAWILKIEEMIAAKDEWIRRLERENAELRAATVQMGDKIRQMSSKHISLLTAKDYAAQFQPLQERIGLIEEEIAAKNSLISKLEMIIAEKDDFLGRLQGDMENIFSLVKDLKGSA